MSGFCGVLSSVAVYVHIKILNSFSARCLAKNETLPLCQAHTEGRQRYTSNHTRLRWPGRCTQGKETGNLFIEDRVGLGNGTDGSRKSRPNRVRTPHRPVCGVSLLRENKKEGIPNQYGTSEDLILKPPSKRFLRNIHTNVCTITTCGR